MVLHAAEPLKELTTPTINRLLLAAVGLSLLLICPNVLSAQISPQTSWAETAHDRFLIHTDITYVVANGVEEKLDVYEPKGQKGPTPVVLYIHGGGWVSTEYNEKSSFLNNLPYLQLGWALVNVQYRLARVSLAPAAVEDCRCALHWLISHSKEYNFDVHKIVVTGHSAGGHLALITGMLPLSAGLDRECNGTDEPHVAAIIDWYGITDVNDLLEGPHREGYAVEWIGGQAQAEAIAKRVSPITYVRAGLPPILMIQGDADTTVPIEQSRRLYAALQSAGDKSELFVVPGGGHGDFPDEWQIRAWNRVFEFLKTAGVMKHSTP